MADYIEREAALEAISEWLMKALHTENMSSYNEGERAAYRTALSEIAELPAADVAQVRHGRWEYDEEAGEYYCSECHRTTDDRHDEIQEYDGKKVIALCLPRYCGYCGARMDGGQNDGTA